jgi:hypothetical protein
MVRSACGCGGDAGERARAADKVRRRGAARRGAHIEKRRELARRARRERRRDARVDGGEGARERRGEDVERDLERHEVDGRVWRAEALEDGRGRLEHARHDRHVRRALQLRDELWQQRRPLGRKVAPRNVRERVRELALD